MVTPLSHHTARRSSRTSCALVLLAALLSAISLPLPVQASNLLEIAELLTHPGQPAYGFLLKDQAGTLKVISLGQIEVREGDQVIVEGVFSRLRQAGRTIIYNEIKALSIKPMNRLNPDLVG